MTESNIQEAVLHRRQTVSPIPDAVWTGKPAAAAYEPPRLVRVKVETTRMVSGLQTSAAHCTQHFHNNVAACPA